MIIPDVNVLVRAHQRESPDHTEIRRWFNDVLASDRSLGIPEIVLCSFVRVVTLSRPWKQPATLAQATEFCAALGAAPRCVILQPSEEHWQRFEQLCLRRDVRGNLITDAYLAVFALERDAEWITTDQDFAKFPGLRWRHPLERQGRSNPR